jgi:hypothetical protein
MYRWVKINGRNFEVNGLKLQKGSPYMNRNFHKYDSNRHFELIIELIISNPSDFDFIKNLYYLNRQIYIHKFDVVVSDFYLLGCLLKSINLNEEKLELEIVGDYIKNKDISEKRNDIIDFILD